MSTETGRLLFLMQIEVLQKFPTGSIVGNEPVERVGAWHIRTGKDSYIPPDVLYDVWGKNDTESHQHEATYNEGDKTDEDLFTISVSHMAPDINAEMYLNDAFGFMRDDLIVGMIESGALDSELSTWLVTEVFTRDYWGEVDSYIEDVKQIHGFESLAK